MRRSLLAARTVYGVGLLLAPTRVLAAMARMPLDHEVVVVARVLGARQLIQAAALGGSPGRGELLAGAAVDGLHAGSMVAAARWASRAAHRRLAARDARSAALLAVAGLAVGTASGATGDARARAGEGRSSQ